MTDGVIYKEAVNNGLVPIVRRFLNEDAQGYSNIVEIDDPESVENLPSALKRELLPSENYRIVLLENMDLEVLPPSTNVLCSILARLDNALARNNVTENRYYGDELNALQKLSILRNDIAIGFAYGQTDYHSRAARPRLANNYSDLDDGYAASRDVDPDVYAINVARIEAARLGVPERFSDMVESLRNGIFRRNDVKFIQTIVLPATMRVPSQLKLFRSPHFLIIVARTSLRGRVDKPLIAPTVLKNMNKAKKNTDRTIKVRDNQDKANRDESFYL